MRWACQAIAGRIGADHQDDTLYLFWEEIFGLNSHFLRAVEAAGSNSTVRTLTGVPASKGTGRGRARDLHRLSPGEVLVCESTSPNWTPAFDGTTGRVTVLRRSAARPGLGFRDGGT